MTEADVQQVARVIARAMGGSKCPNIGTDDDITVTCEDIYAAQAATAVILAAIRPPTPAMIEAGRAVPCDSETSGGVIYSSSAEVRAIWTAMIDAIGDSATTGDEK